MVAAVALMACNSNSVDPGTSSSVSQLTANVASAFGKSAAEVKADFEKAGFVKVMNTTGSLTKPAFKKFQPAINKPSAEKNLEVYVLNAPKNFDQLIRWRNGHCQHFPFKHPDAPATQTSSRQMCRSGLRTY